MNVDDTGPSTISTDVAVADPVAEALLAQARAGIDPRFSAEVVEQAIRDGWLQGWRPVRSLINAGVPWRSIEQAAWRHQGFEVVELIAESVPSHLFAELPLTMARQMRAVPVSSRENEVTVAVADPTDYVMLEDLRERFGDLEVTFAVADAERITEVIDEIELKGRTEAIEVTAEEEDFETFVSLDADDFDGRIARLVRDLVLRAASNRASDIHIEPSESVVTIRFRIDGVLHTVASHPLGLGQGLTNRLKVMANLDVSERRIPQDGRFGLKLPERSLDIRLVTIPTVWEVEEAVMRILDQSRQVNDLDVLGYSPHVVEQWKVLAANPHGALLATGPTGSGKSTTLYATLKRIATPDKKVLTVEDPVEFRMSGISQVQVNPKAGLDFARALRSFLRADPDIMLVGEIRDRETALTAIEAALTGHLVLASLHTNSAPAAATRLIKMQIAPFLVASALRGVVSQRLLRVLCETCRHQIPTPTKVFDSIADQIEIPSHIYSHREGGCGSCSNTGFRGRMAIAEVVTIGEEMERAIADEVSERELERLAVRHGMVPLFQDGLMKVAQGYTTLDEVSRVAS